MRVPDDVPLVDHVVHEDHGVARFAGFETREVGGITRDYLYLEYKGEDRVYVPTDQFAKLSRYSGGAGSPTLSALGGKKWLNMRARARDAASEIAGDLVNLYAERKTRKGHAFGPDSEWQMEVEANFPWRETADQIEAIEAVKAGAGGHGGGDRHDALVPLRFRDQGLGEYIGVAGRSRRRLGLRAGNDIEFLHAMIFVIGGFRGRITLALLRNHMDEARPLGHIAHIFEHRDELIEIMPVDRPDIIEAELLEERAAGEREMDQGNVI